jgi:hypothetical protein
MTMPEQSVTAYRKLPNLPPSVNLHHAAVHEPPAATIAKKRPSGIWGKQKEVLPPSPPPSPWHRVPRESQQRNAISFADRFLCDLAVCSPERGVGTSKIERRGGLATPRRV